MADFLRSGGDGEGKLTMDDRLDVFIEKLLEALQPHGGCQCGCAMRVLGAVGVAAERLREHDEAMERINDQALEDALSDQRYGSGE